MVKVDEQRTRTCGSCGNVVGPSDTLCPTCGALLAAYEAPAGSTENESTSAPPITSKADTPPSATDQPPSTIATTAPETPTTPVVPSTAFDADITLGEARRALVTSLEQREPVRAVADSVSPAPLTSRLEPEASPTALRDPVTDHKPDGAALPVSGPIPGTAPARTAAAPEPRSGSPRQNVRRMHEGPPSTTASTKPADSVTASAPASVPASPRKQPNLVAIAGVIPMLLVLCWMLVTLDFSNVIVLGFVLVILFNLIKVAARFSGRKTTALRPPDRTDR
jgi:hypothetical protein